MPIISEQFQTQNLFPYIKFKAPTGFLYEVHSIYGSIYTSASNQIGVLARAVEEPDDFSMASNPMLFSIDAGVIHTGFVQFPVPEQTKYLTIVSDNDTVCGVHIVINYKLVKATIADQIWEFVRRGKNP